MDSIVQSFALCSCFGAKTTTKLEERETRAPSRSRSRARSQSKSSTRTRRKSKSKGRSRAGSQRLPQSMTSHVELYENSNVLYESQSTMMSQSELIETYTKHSWVDNKQSSICIIGAGQAGIHMATLLIRSGYRNVVVLEHNDFSSTSGKVVSVPDEEYEVVHDLGTANIHSNYMSFFRLLDHYGDRKQDLIDVDYSQSVVVNGAYTTGISLENWISGPKNDASPPSKSNKGPPLSNANTSGSSMSSEHYCGGNRSATVSTTTDTTRPQTPRSPLPTAGHHHTEQSPQSQQSLTPQSSMIQSGLSPLSPSPDDSPSHGPMPIRSDRSPTMSSWMAPRDTRPSIVSNALTVSHAAKRYIKIHRKIFGNYESVNVGDIVNRFPAKPLKFQYINMTFLEFIKKYKLEVLIPYFVYNQSLLEGYGHLDEVPAFYGLLWNNCSSMFKLVDGDNRPRGFPNLKACKRMFMVKDGLDSLFKKMISEEDIEIKYNSEITSINRYLNDEKHKICVMYCQTVDNEEYEKLIECDALFCAANIKELLPLLNDVTEHEEACFSSLETHVLCSTLIECDVVGNGRGFREETEDDDTEVEDTMRGLDLDDEKEPLKDMTCTHTPSDTPTLSIINPSHLSVTEDVDGRHLSFAGPDLFEDKACVFYPEKLLNKDGHLFQLKNTSLMINGEEHFEMQRKKGLFRERLVAYQLIAKDDISYSAEPRDLKETLETKLRDDLMRVGKRNVKIEQQNVMPFCPQWTQKEINNSVPWIVKDELQGKNKSFYYIGSSVCFQSIESVMEYNEQLVRNTFILNPWDK